MYFSSYHPQMYAAQNEYADNTDNIYQSSSSFPQPSFQTCPSNPMVYPRSKLSHLNRAPHKGDQSLHQQQHQVVSSKLENHKQSQNYLCSNIQDENINTFNVRQNIPKYHSPEKTQKAHEVGITKKAISKQQKSNSRLSSFGRDSQNQAANLISHQNIRSSKESAGINSKGLRSRVLKKHEPIKQEQNRVYSFDPLVRTLEQFFPEVAEDCEIHMDNANLEQIDQLVSSLPLTNPGQMYETMKSLTSSQERKICSKIKESNTVDIMAEISKISPEYDLKGLSLEQLHEKLNSIQKHFEEQEIKNSKLREQQQVDSPLLEPSNIETPKKEYFNDTELEFAPVVKQIKQENMKGLKQPNVANSLYLAQEQSPINQPNNVPNPMEQNRASDNKTRSQKRSETLNNSCLRNQVKVQLSASETMFTSPFRSTTPGTTIMKDPLQGQCLQSSLRSSSSFKKGHSQFLDYIDNVLIEGAFSPEEDIFHKITSSEAACAFSLHVLPKHLNQQLQPCQASISSAKTHNSSAKNLRSQQGDNRMQTEDGFETTGKKKYFHQCNRVRNFIADEDDYENVHPFLLSSQQYNSSSGSRDHRKGQKHFGAISSFLHDIDDLNMFSQQGFL